MKTNQLTGLDRALLERAKHDARPRDAKAPQALPEERVTLGTDELGTDEPPRADRAYGRGRLRAAPPASPAASERARAVVNDHGVHVGGGGGSVVLGDGAKLVVNDHGVHVGGGGGSVVLGDGAKLVVNDHGVDAPAAAAAPPKAAPASADGSEDAARGHGRRKASHAPDVRAEVEGRRERGFDARLELYRQLVAREPPGRRREDAGKAGEAGPKVDPGA